MQVFLYTLYIEGKMAVKLIRITIKLIIYVSQRLFINLIVSPLRYDLSTMAVGFLFYTVYPHNCNVECCMVIALIFRDEAKHLKWVGEAGVGGFYLKFELQC